MSTVSTVLSEFWLFNDLKKTQESSTVHESRYALERELVFKERNDMASYMNVFLITLKST